MPSRRQGARTIVVDDRQYLWWIRRKPTYGQAIAETGMVVAILSQEGGCRLAVELASARPDNWMGQPAMVVTPNAVARFFERAIAGGWHPAKNGPTFVLQIDDWE